MRRIAFAAASIAVVIGAVGLAPAALASDESAEFSSLASGVAVSGSASSTYTAGYSDGYVWALIEFPTALFSTQTWTGEDPGNCDTYGITLALNGTPLAITRCQSRAGGNAFGTPTNFLYAETATMPNPVAGDVVTISWGSSYMSTLEPLAGETVYVSDSNSYIQIAVTPTLLSAGAGTPIPMWMQAVARASADTVCPAGFSPSWDTWPNGGKGGLVCNRFVPVYGN